MSFQPRILEAFVGLGNAPTNGYPAFVAAGTASSTDGASAPAPGNPAGLDRGDFKVCALYSREATDGSVAIDSSLGWTELYNERTTGGILAVWYRFHRLLDPPPRFTLTNHASGDDVIAQVAAFSGVNRLNPITAVGALSTNGSQANIGAIAGVTLPAFGMLIAVGGKADDWTSVAPLSQSGLTFAEIGETDSTAGNDAGMVWDYATVDDGSKTAITDKTFAVTGGASAVGMGAMFALRPERSVTLPIVDYELESSQPLRSPLAAIAGADYGFRHRGLEPGLKGFGRERLRCRVLTLNNDPEEVDDDLDALAAGLREIGLGILRAVDENGDYRWCYAALASMPQVRWRAGMIFSKNVSLDFDRLSDWFAEDEVTATVTIDETPEYFEIENTGNAPATWIIFRLVAASSSGFTNPQLENLTNGYQWSSTTDAAAVSDELKIDGEEASVEKTADAGVSYANDFANFSLPATQYGFMRLEVGVNSFKYTDGGTPDATLEYAFFPPFDQ